VVFVTAVASTPSLRGRPLRGGSVANRWSQMPLWQAGRLRGQPLLTDGIVTSMASP